MAKKIKEVIKNLIAPRYAKLHPLKIAVSLSIAIAILSLGINIFFMIKTSQFSNQALIEIAINFVYNLVSGFLTGFIFAWIYNKLI